MAKGDVKQQFPLLGVTGCYECNGVRQIEGQKLIERLVICEYEQVAIFLLMIRHNCRDFFSPKT